MTSNNGGAARRTLRTVVRATAALGVAAAGLTACSSTKSTAPSTASKPSTCQAPSGWQSVTASAVGTPATDYTLTSFDGTKIRMHWFPNANSSTAAPMPTVLMGPGWGQAGDTNTGAVGLLGSLSIGDLWKAGFNVMTWDPRGFGASDGVVEVDSVDFEAKDVSNIISWIATQPGVTLDRPGVPRIGMVGGSYGGGIQFVTAATDCRVDAIAPTIAWNSLETSLFKNQTVKSGWSGILSQVATTHTLDPHVTAANEEQKSNGTASQASVDFFVSRGPGELLRKVKVPTLLLEGTVDDLFTLAEAVANYEVLTKQGTTTSMAWFCGGHGVCLTDPGTTIDVGAMSVNWMRRYVKGDVAAPVLKGFEFVDQNGVAYLAPSFPPASGPPITGAGSGTLALTDGGGSGPAMISSPSSTAGVVGSVARAVSPGEASHAVNVDVVITQDAMIAGTPKVSLTYSGSSPKGTKPTRVFAQLVDPATHIVVGNQITPIPVILDGASHTLMMPLEMIGFAAAKGSHLTLQLVATTVAYSTPRLGGSLDFTKINLTIPTVTGVTRATTAR